MKDVKTLNEPDEIRAYIRSRFKTPTFLAEMDKPGSLINRVVERATKYPLFVYQFSDHPSADTPEKEKTEWAHFGAWMGGITEREYAEEVKNDNYWLHELYHKGFSTYMPDMSEDGFEEKILRNELEASVVSEIEVYLRHPELRQGVFKNQEIFADRLLRDPKFMARFKADPDAVHDELIWMRREPMHDRNPSNPTDFWIRKFAQQNKAWVGIWSRRFNEVETHMWQLHKDIDEGMPRKQAMDKYMNWLQSPEVTQGSEIPFLDEAKAFSGVYNLNNRHYEEAVAAGKVHNPVANALQRKYGDNIDLDQVGIDIAGARPLPHWAETDSKGYTVTEGQSEYHGAFVWNYIDNSSAHLPKGSAPRAEDIDVFVQVRGEKGPNGEKKYGTFGGHLSFKLKEQPVDTGVRESHEEWVDDQGNSVITLKPEELTPIDGIEANGIDYRKKVPVAFNGFSRPVSREEAQNIDAHIARLSSDPAYAKAVFDQSHGEVQGIERMSLKQALELPPESFMHPHECAALHKWAEQLLQPERSKQWSK